MSESAVALELFLRWLNAANDGAFRLLETRDQGAVASDDARRLVIEVRPLLGPIHDVAWLSARHQLEELTAGAAPGGTALWVPLGADLPAGEPAVSDFIDHVRRAALRLGPHERAHVPLPVKLLLRKSADGGNVVSVTGGLNPHWARFTERVHGTFDLDSTRLHRLPDAEDHLEKLLDTVVERSAKLEVGQITEIETVDSWTVQRVDLADTTIIGVPAAEAQEAGLAVRRNLRRILEETPAALRVAGADVKALVLLGYFARLEDESATIAMRGFSPALYSGLDYVCLVADGLLKPLIRSD